MFIAGIAVSSVAEKSARDVLVVVAVFRNVPWDPPSAKNENTGITFSSVKFI